MSLVYERHTIAFFGPLAQPNYQMYSIVIKYPAEFTNIVVINITRYVYLYAYICLVLSKTPIKIYLRI